VGVVSLLQWHAVLVVVEMGTALSAIVCLVVGVVANSYDRLTD
jgi:hypothetical protein